MSPTRTELRLPAAPVKDILKRAGLRVTPDAVDTARALAEDALEATAKRAAEDVLSLESRTMDGNHFASWWSA